MNNKFEEQKKIIEEQKKIIEEQKQKIEEQKKTINDLKKQITNNTSNSNNNSNSSNTNIDEQKNMRRDSNKLIEEMRLNIRELKKPGSNTNNIIKNMETKLNELHKRINEEKIDVNEIMVVNFRSTDGNVQYAVPCSKKNIFAEIEEKLYQQYPEYRDTNNNFLANGSVILRFKTIEENNIGTGFPITMDIP